MMPATFAGNLGIRDCPMLAKASAGTGYPGPVPMPAKPVLGPVQMPVKTVLGTVASVDFSSEGIVP
ncbi:MAG: hypothetical protein IPK46_20385 [Saprospiraceae bacterium]|nr:hypothetical protein [Saprospiraceae bacterium]